MAKKYDLLTSYEWLGDFWLEEFPDSPFPGVLKYSPSSGVTLSILHSNNQIAETVKENVTILGQTIESGPITLLACIRKGNATSNTVRIAEDFFSKAAIIGKHVSSDCVFNSCVFTLNNIDDFFRPQAKSLSDSYQEKPVLEFNSNDISVSIRKNATGNFVGKERISDLFMLNTDDEKHRSFMSELDKVGKELLDKYDINNLASKSKVAYEVVISRGTEERKFQFQDIRKECYTVSSLFSMLMLKPVNIIKMSVRSSQGDQRVYNSVLLSLWLTPELIKRSQNEVSYHFLPINHNGISHDFNSILNSWRSFQQDECNLVYSVVHEHLSGHYNSFSHCALLISALEQWVFKYSDAPESEKAPKKKYDWFIDKYCTEEMKNSLRQKLPVPNSENESLGKLLSQVRGVVLHPTNGNHISNVALDNLSEIIYLMLVIAIYEKIGIAESAVSKIKNKFENRLRIIEEY